MTEVQRCALPHGIYGRDLMVASRTGSGKTLIYAITLVEKLYREKWVSWDGCGGVVILPTRELVKYKKLILSLIGSLSV